SAAERAGDFSEDGPLTGTSAFPLVGENGQTYPAGTSYSTIFPTSHVPVSDFNAVALNLTSKYVPLPNAPGNLYEFNPVTATHTNQYITRIDYNASEKDSIYGYWFIEPSNSTDTLPFTGATLPGFGDLSKQRT